MPTRAGISVEIHAITAVTPWSGSLAREPGAPSRPTPGAPQPQILEGEFIAGSTPRDSDGRSRAERIIDAEWRRSGARTDRPRSAAGAAAAYEHVAALGAPRAGVVDVYV